MYKASVLFTVLLLCGLAPLFATDEPKESKEPNN